MVWQVCRGPAQPRTAHSHLQQGLAVNVHHLPCLLQLLLLPAPAAAAALQPMLEHLRLLMQLLLL